MFFDVGSYFCIVKTVYSSAKMNFIRDDGIGIGLVMSVGINYLAR